MSLLLAVAAVGASSTLPQASIPFVSSDGILEWQGDGDKGIWIRSNNGKWYYGEFMGGSCSRLPSAQNLMFDASPIDRLDRNSTIVAQSWHCPLSSLVKSATPPRKRKG